MSKVLAGVLALAAFVSAAANAPGITFARGGHEEPLPAGSAALVGNVAGNPPGNHTQASIPPDSLDPGAWLDSVTTDAQAQLVAWQHAWTDSAVDPVDSYYTTPGGFSRYGQPARWEPEGVLLAGNLSSGSFTPGRFASGGGIDYGASIPSSKGTRTPGSSDNRPIDDVGDSPNPADDPVSDTSDDTSAVPGNESSQDDSSDAPIGSLAPDPTGDQPVNVPEPASMTLLALGLAGLALFRRRRSLPRGTVA